MLITLLKVRFCDIDTIVYICGKHIVCFEHMKRVQSFITLHGDEGDVTAMNVFFGNKGGNTPILLVAVAHRSQQLTLPSAKVYNKTHPQPYNIVLSHLPVGGKIISMCFFNRAKYIAILVEIEPRVLYHLAICGISGSSDLVYKEELKGKYSKLSNSPFDSSLLALSSETNLKIYQSDKSGGVNYHSEKTTQINSSIVLEQGDYIVDHCWLKNEAKLFVTTTMKIFAFENCVFEAAVNFEFPAIELKTIITDKIFHDKPEKDSPEGDSRARQGKYHAVDYLISYLNPTGGESSKKKMPDFLRFAIEQELEANHGGVSYDGLREEARRNVLKIIYSRFSRDIVEEKGIKISCICRQETGFAVGFKGIGMIAVFKRKKDSYFMESCSVMKSNNYDIWSMSGSIDDSRIIVTAAYYKFSNDERMAEQLSTGIEKAADTVELVVFQSNIVGTIKNSAMEPFEFLYPHGSHSQAITNVAVVPTKSFAGTISKDLTFKLWQYNGDQKQLMSFVPSYNFESTKHDLAMDMHPLAVQVAIGLKQCFRVYYLVEGELYPAYENYAKGACFAVAYSSRGQYLAAGFSNEILIYDPYSFSIITTIKSSVDGVKSLEWTGRDRYLVSLCNSSYFSITDSWNNFAVKIDESKVSRPLGKMTALTYDAEFDLMVCCCSDQVLRIYNCMKEEFYAECDNSQAGITFTSVLLVKKLGCIFFGTQTGAVRVYLWPFSDQKKQAFDSTQCLVHTGAVTSIRITPSMEHLVTTSVDGTLFFLRIQHPKRGNETGTGDAGLGGLADQKDQDLLHRLSNTYSLNEFTYMSTVRQKDMAKKMTELENALMTKITEIDNDNENLTNKFNEELQRREKQNTEELKRMNIGLAARMDDEGTKQKSLEMECKEAKRTLKDKVKEKELMHRKLLMELYAEREEIEKQMKEFEEENEQEILDSKIRFEAVVSRLKEEYGRNKQQINTQYGQAIFYLKEDQKKFQEALRQTEEEYNSLLEETKKTLNDNLDKRKKATEEARTMHTKLIKDSLKYQERIDNLDKLITETKVQNTQLRQDIQLFQDKYDEMDSRLNQQELVINQKESKIKEYRNKNYHLQNFKSVYDYQVTTLKDEHEPLTEYADNLNVGQY